MDNVYASSDTQGEFRYKNASGNGASTGNSELDTQLNSLSPEERKAVQEQAQQPLTGEEIAMALKQNPNFNITKQEYHSYLGWHKNESGFNFSGILEGGSAILGEFGNAYAAAIDHPLSYMAKAPASLLEAFAQGTRNLYGMVAQSQDPNSILFKFKDALAGNGSDEGYRQFLEARKFNIDSNEIAAGNKTLVVNKDYIDHDLTLAASYIADPTLLVPYLGEATGATKAISAAMRATAMGEKIAALGGKVGAIKAGIIGGTLKYAVGAPLEMVGGTIRGTIDATAKAGASIFETATGISATEARQTLKGVGVTSSAASFAGHGIPVVSDISNVYLGANVARGAGEAIGAVGEQIMKQGGKRGFNSFAAQAILDTEANGIKLSGQAKGLLRVINAVDPVFSYGASVANGMTHGAMIGGTLGYLSGEGEGAAHGIGAGMALGSIGAFHGKVFSDISGGTKWQRAEIQGGFALDVMKNLAPENYKGWSLLLEGAGNDMAKRRTILQAIAGVDNIAGDHTMFTGNKAAFEASVKSQGYDLQGRHIDPKTGELTIGKDGKPVETMATADEFHATEGFVVTKADGKIGIHINLDKWANGKSADVLPHELFHAVMRQTEMYKEFLGGWTSHLLGKFGADGTKLEAAKVDPKEFMEFQKRYIERLPISEADKLEKIQFTKTAMDEFAKAGGDLAKMHEANPEAAAHLKYQAEEFGAYYFTQWIKGKPIDYLFHGGKLPTIRGALDSMGNRWVDFWANKINKEAPSFNFNAKDANGNRVGLDAAFSGNGEGRVRVPAMDMMLQDLIRAQSGQKSKGAVTVGAMTPTGRLNWIKNNGVDGLIHAIDPQTGAWLGVDKTRYSEWQKKNAKDVVGALNQLHGKNEDSYTGNRTDVELKHLVEQGVWTQAFADRIKSFQEAIANPDASNTFHHDYHGNSKERENAPRLRGDEVPVTNRTTIPVKLDLNFNKDGTFAANLHSVDMKVVSERVNEQWKDPVVRALWGDNHDDMMQDFVKYINNASKEKDARVDSAILLEDGRGNGAQIRNIFHQMLGFAKSEKVDYFNPAIKDIVREKFGSFQTLSVDLMSPLRHDASATRLNVSQDSFRLLSRNFKVSDMAEEKTPNGIVYTHETGYKIIKEDKTGNIKAFDTEGKLLGVFKDSKQAEAATKTHYEAQQAKIPKMQADAAKAQDKVQKGFKVLTEEDKAQAVERKDVFKTDKMQDFSHGTEVIPQTREEFYNEHFLKLRQSDPATVLAITENVLARSDVVRKQKDAIQVQMDAAEKGGSKVRDTYLKLRDEFQRLERMVRTDDLQRVYNRAKTSGADIGQAVLDYINTSRKNGLRYDEMAKQFFGASFDSKTATGKPVTVVATHGTNSPQLLLDMHFDPSKLGVGGRHGSAADGIGAFLAGEIKTSRGYGISETEANYRQVRAAVRFDNPLVIDGEFNNYSPRKYENYIKAGIEGGHDGLIIHNIYDGGSADTVYVPFKKGIADKTVILDSIDENVWRSGASWDASAADKTFPWGESTEAAYPKTNQEPVPRGVKTMRDFTGSWKVGDDAPKMSPQDALKEAAFERVVPVAKIDEAKLAGRYEENVPIQRLAGKSVAVLAYDSAGVLSLANKKSGQAIAGAESFGGGMHSVRSEALGFGHTAIASTLQGVNAIIKVLASVHQKAKLAGEKHYYATILGANPDKLLSSTVGVRASNAHLTQLMAKGMLSEKDVRGTLLKIASDKAFPNLGITEGMTTAEMLQSISAIFAKPLDPNAKVTAQSKGSAFKQKTAFVDLLVKGLKDSDSWQANKDGIQKYFGTTESMKSNEGIKRALGLSITDPTNFDKSGNLVKNGHMFLALEFITGKEIEWSKGGHPSYPNDIRYKDGTPVKILRFEEPMLATDAAGSKEGVDIGNKITVQKGYPKEHPLHGFQQRDASGNLLFLDQPAYTYEVPTGSGTGEMKMKQAADMVHRDPNFNTGKNTAELGLKDLLKFKVSDANTKPDLKPFEGKFKVSEPVLKGVSRVDELIAQETDKSNLSPDVKANFAKFKEAIRKQDATDEVLIPEVRESYDALRDKINSELTNGLTLTPAPVLKSILKALDGIDKKLNKDTSRIAGKIHAGDMAEGASLESDINAQSQGQYRQSQNEGADLEAEVAQQGQATHRRDMAEGADVESHTAQQADLQEGADLEAEGMPKPSAKNPQFPYPAPATPAIPKPAPVAATKQSPVIDQAAIDASKKAEFDKYQALKDKVAARNNPSAPAEPAQTPVTPAQQAPVAPETASGTPPIAPNVQRLWRGYTAESSPNGTVWKNAVGWIIMNQGDKFKVYNPQQAMQGIYNDLESAKRRVQRAEPKQ